jgi:hypothetical protein
MTGATLRVRIPRLDRSIRSVGEKPDRSGVGGSKDAFWLRRIIRPVARWKTVVGIKDIGAWFDLTTSQNLRSLASIDMGQRPII